MTHNEHLEELASINAINGIAEWYSWGSPLGLIIFFNGMALFGILVRYAILMK